MKPVALLAVALVATGCRVVDDIADCGKLHSQSACEDADVGDDEQCAWVETVVVHGDDDCGEGTRHSRCIGFSGTQQGCSPYACGGEQGEDFILYHRPTDEGAVEVLQSPICGPQPFGHWEECQAFGPEQCACGCALAEARTRGD